MDKDLIFNTLQLIGGILLTAGYFPQIVKTIETKNVESFSMNYLVLVSGGVFLMETYAINMYVSTGNGIAFLITNTLSLLCALIMLSLGLIFKKKSPILIPVETDDISDNDLKN